MTHVQCLTGEMFIELLLDLIENADVHRADAFVSSLRILTDAKIYRGDVAGARDEAARLLRILIDTHKPRTRKTNPPQPAGGVCPGRLFDHQPAATSPR